MSRILAIARARHFLSMALGQRHLLELMADGRKPPTVAELDALIAKYKQRLDQLADDDALDDQPPPPPPTPKPTTLPMQLVQDDWFHR